MTNPPKTAKHLLIKQLKEAYSINDEMSFKVSLENLSQEEASWRLNELTWTIEEIIYHCLSASIEYCKQGFDSWESGYDEPIGKINSMIS
ncbi:MAG: hypothetical protein ACXAC2_17330, partial [Candidatus Kariarchaeaceae archaeon]